MTSGELEQICLLTGGDPFGAGQPVAPAALSVLGDQLTVPILEAIEGRRRAFAEWVASDRNPLTKRNIVAGNPNNFGSTGKFPTQPQRNDDLASRRRLQCRSYDRSDR
jgi:hypothetical protein